MGKDHLTEIVSLERLCFAEPWSIEQYRKSLEQDSFRVFGILHNNCLNAYISLYLMDDEAEIISLAVHPQCRKMGLGKSLVSKALLLCRLANVGRVFLETRASNIPALKIYRGLGFAEVARRKNYYPDNLEDALVLRLDIFAADRQLE